MKKEIKETEESLQYFEDKKRMIKIQIRSLKRKLSRKTKYKPRNYLISLYHNDEIENLLSQIEAYELRIEWCNVNIKIKKEKSKNLHLLNKLRIGFQIFERKLLLKKDNNSMENYFLKQETRVMQNKLRFYHTNAV